MNLIIRDGQKQIGTIEVQTFRGDNFVAQLAINRGGSARLVMPLDVVEIDALIAALNVAKKTLRKIGD
jgi:hypothetical protein